MTTPERGRKVGIVGPFPPLRGGIAHFTEQFYRALSAQGQNSVGVSFSRQYPEWLFPGTSQYDPGPNQGLEADVVPLLDSLNPLSWDRSANWLISKGVTDVVFMYWMPFFAPAYWRMARLLKAKGVVVTTIVHNAAPHEKQPFGAFLSRQFLSVCARRIALSAAVEDSMRAIGITEPTEVSVHPTYNQFGERLEKRDARFQLGLEEQANVLLFFGLVRRYKGLDILIRALDNVTTPVTLVVAGEWYDGKTELQELIQKAPPKVRIVCRNEYIPDSDVKLYFSAADVLVQPYREATQSGVVQIGFHFGIPAIVTNVGGLPEMIQHDENGLVVQAENPAVLAEAIDLFFEPGRAKRLSDGALRARENYSWEAFTTQFLR